MTDEVQKTPRSRIKREFIRADYQRETINGILDAGLVCHVGYVIDGAPYVTPTLHWRDGDRVYWHGSSASRALLSQAGPADACLTVTHLDGIVMARSGYFHSINYRSVMLFGKAMAVESDEEKIAALHIFMEHLAPGRWDEVRPPDDQEIKATTVMWMPIDEGAAKVRTGPPDDREEDLSLDCWAGVVPVVTSLGTPDPESHLPEGTPVPDYLSRIRLS